MKAPHTAASAQQPAAPAIVVGKDYDDDWLERYDRSAGADAAILKAEMEALEALFEGFEGIAGLTGLEGRGDEPGGRGARHLDLGTCTGRYLRWGVARGFASAHGIDKSAASVNRCRAMAETGPIHVHHADFLDAEAMPPLLDRHGPFHLVTMMMGTINHLAAEDQYTVVRNLVPALPVSGRLVISSWRPGACALSLYSRVEQRNLGLTGFGARLNADQVGGLGLRLAERRFTEWHELRVYAPSAAPGAAL